jgi:iron(III) transport system ATP-binding protein
MKIAESANSSAVVEPPATGTVGAPALGIDGLEKHYGPVRALAGVDLVVSGGEFVTLLGPSGCGKSTLLRIVAGIESPTNGIVRLGTTLVNDPARKLLVPPERRNLSMVFQSYAIWPHMTVAENVSFPLRYRRVARRDRRSLVLQALHTVEMESFADRYPHQLSGGQQQRVALARSIVSHPSLLLLDEPLSNLDARLREVMRMEIKRLHVELGLTVLYVTHDQSEALAMSDRILVMDAGRTLQEGSPEQVYAFPNSLTVARFLGVKNLIDGVSSGSNVVELLGRTLPVRHAGSIPPGSRVTVAIRPDGFRVAGPDSNVPALTGEVRLVEFLGSAYEHEVVVDRTTLVVQTAERLGQRGDEVKLAVQPGGAVAFAEIAPTEEPE